MKYDRIILISIDSLGKEYSYYFNKYFTTSYENYSVTSSWTLPSHLTMLSGIKKPNLQEQKNTKGYLKYQNYVKNIPTIASMLKRFGFKARSITGGGFLSKFFGWGWDWNKWVETDDRSEWRGEKILPKKNELLFLHTYYVHDWFKADKLLYKELNQFKKDLEKGKKIDSRAFESHLKRGESEYKKRIQTIAEKLAWIKNVDAKILVIFTSDHAEIFSDKPGEYHHGNLAAKNPDIFKVPLLIKENVKKNRVLKEKYFDFQLLQLIFAKIGHDSGAKD